GWARLLWHAGRLRSQTAFRICAPWTRSSAAPPSWQSPCSPRVSHQHMVAAVCPIRTEVNPDGTYFHVRCKRNLATAAVCTLPPMLFEFGRLNLRFMSASDLARLEGAAEEFLPRPCTQLHGAIVS